MSRSNPERIYSMGSQKPTFVNQEFGSFAMNYSRKELIIDFLADRWIEILIGLLLAFFFVVMVAAAKDDYAKKQAFMESCLADGKKEYECTAMWRAGEKSPVIYPVVIPVR